MVRRVGGVDRDSVRGRDAGDRAEPVAFAGIIAMGEDRDDVVAGGDQCVEGGGTDFVVREENDLHREIPVSMMTPELLASVSEPDRSSPESPAMRSMK